ncbi:MULTISPECIES: hypothetical protein [Streptomyces]|uniref:Uncharacterized protein n=1 Tax=Streptomyces tsukubensis (strain DSM 42081 / NBRC 108919 / NRRL 18488 / 9993) TaxID=1114943 RepID=I2N109_STRT9|nr:MULTISPECIES: hypothetical protein [Streptomyces]AZK94904.1 hypothetical protein B7R87_14275 [Streptomyces tsukubensis]EIF90706.1 hypothetical protein [Streptomyces tsukubensis NRRL18488]MYS63576.1 hypothetical protein [Streptomyces sp. SID5473]QKM69017.1 hypothetical protein STSU_019500 [Streptomyces tsukubensis NRRL18488]TAI40764.1 hypothetical protein EWI31_30740 [Streptomyces tsukubensis]
MPHPAPPAAPDSGSQAGVIGIALGGVLAAVLAQGSWQWFSTYIGATLLALIVCFYRLPRRTPGSGATYFRNLTAYSMVVGLCVAITLAPALQRWSWLFPMPGTRGSCPKLGVYASEQAAAALSATPGFSPTALAAAQRAQSHEAVADCLSSTTTRWLPAYAAAVAVLVGIAAWSFDRARARREPPVA